MSILLGRNGITPWIEEAAYTDVSTDWSTIGHSTPHSNQPSETDTCNRRLFLRPRPAKVVQVVACCWQTLHNKAAIQQSSTLNNGKQCDRISCFPYLMLHDGLTSVNAFLSEKVQEKLFSSSPEEATAQQLQNHLQAQMARKPGSIVRISGWSFSTVVVCTGKKYFQFQKHNPLTHHQLSWPLALLIEDSVELIGAEGSGQTVDRPRDVNESLRIQSALSICSHWDLYQRLAMAYSYFNNKSSRSTKINNKKDNDAYFLPDLRGFQPASDVLSIIDFITTVDELYRDDDQNQIAGINEMLSDDSNDQEFMYQGEGGKLKRKIEVITQKSQPSEAADQAQVNTMNPHRKLCAPRKMTLKRYSDGVGNNRQMTSGSAKQTVDMRPSSQLHYQSEPSYDREYHLEPQFDTQPENLKKSSIGESNKVTQYSKEKSEKTGLYQEPEFDTQLPQLHVKLSDRKKNDNRTESETSKPVLKAQLSPEAQAHHNASNETELPLGPQLDTQIPLRSSFFSSEPSCVMNLRLLGCLEADLPLEEAQFDTQPFFTARLVTEVTKESPLLDAEKLSHSMHQDFLYRIQSPAASTSVAAVGESVKNTQKKKSRFRSLFLSHCGTMSCFGW